MRIGIRVITALAFGLGFQHGAVAQTAGRCRPYTDINVPITAPGSYCLTRTLVGGGVRIAANDVTLDLKGFSIIRDPAIQEWTTGVAASGENIKVANGIVSDFHTGVSLRGLAADGVHTVENMLVRGSKVSGISICTHGHGIIRNNTIVDTIAVDSSNDAQGISVVECGGEPRSATVVTIEANRIHNTRASSANSADVVYANGIHVWNATSAVIRGNTITDVTASPGQAAGIFGFSFFPHTWTVSDNTIINSTYQDGSTGVHLVQSNRETDYSEVVRIFGTISRTRIYGFSTGIRSLSRLWPSDTPVVTISLASNVVGGAAIPYEGGKLLRGNRIE